MSDGETGLEPRSEYQPLAAIPPPWPADTNGRGPGKQRFSPGAVTPLRTAGGALLNWWRAMTLDALIVGLLWLIGLEILHVPWAPLWALLGAFCQFIPGVGGMLAVAGPAIATAFSGGDSEDTLFRVCMVLGLYAVIAILEGLVIAPYILHRTTLVPWWASVLGPIVLGLLIPPWGVLIAPPLLAIIFAFKRRKTAA